MATTLDGFRTYLGRFGLQPGTVAIYVHHAKRATEDGGWIERLKRGAPKTRRLVRAAARRWADYAVDPALREALGEFRLPPPRRAKEKVPVDAQPLQRLMLEVRAAKDLTPPMRAVIGLMAYRGFRDADVLRMQRAQIVSALVTGRLSFVAKGRRYLEFTVLKTFKPWLELLAHERGWDTVAHLLVPTSKDEEVRLQSAARKVQRQLKRLGGRCGIDGLHPHRLRRTYAVTFLRAHAGDAEALPKLMEHMQWANLSTAMQYVDHVRGEAIDRVAESMFEPPVEERR
ncbi:MAG: tyrosine-type recombinase/integrase [Thermomicrobiales bacterium]|nr:tyrosine-type recombinase/integrase [Thermomicrobiales bacterium]